MQIIDNKDYFDRPEVSNSDLTTLLYAIYPRDMPDPKEAYAKGTLFDLLLSEPEFVDYTKKEVRNNGELLKFSDEDFDTAIQMKRALLKDPLFQQIFFNSLKRIDENIKYQVAMVSNIEYEYRNIKFWIAARCKFDFWKMIFGGDFKSTACTTQSQFDEACVFFGYDRQRSLYMNISGAKSDVIFGVSKKNFKVFTKKISRNDNFYKEGHRKNTELAQYFYYMFGSDRTKLLKLK